MKKAIGMLCILLSLASFLQAQTYQSGRRTLNFTDPARANRAVGVELFYPADAAGNGVPIAAGNIIFPVVVFGHGFVLPFSAYNWLGDSLAKHGYFAAFPTTEGGFSPSHANFAADLNFVATALFAEGNNNGSFIFQRVSNKAVVGGHSMGGGCSLLAAASNAAWLKAVFNFAAAETNPSATTASLQVNRPSLLFSGSNDCIVPPAVQAGMFNNIPAQCKTLINITGATHCQPANNSFLCTVGQSTSGCNSSPISTATVFSKSFGVLLPFLNYYLKEDCTQGLVFLSAYNNLTGAVKQNTCSSLPDCGIVPLRLLDFYASKSAAQVVLNWKVADDQTGNWYQVEKSTDAQNFLPLRKIFSQIPRSSYQLTDSSIVRSRPTFYRLRFADGNGHAQFSKTIVVNQQNSTGWLLSIAPNPVSSSSSLRLIGTNSERIQLNVYAASGSLVATRQLDYNSGTQQIPLSFIGKIPSGSYYLRVLNNNGALLASQAFLKENK